MVLTCDVCKTQIFGSSVVDDHPASITLFPCFHKHCEKCKSSLNNCQQQNGRIACKLCGCHCLPSQLYEHMDVQLERIYCMHCDIKNRSQVEWCCETCQKRFLCNVCSKDHVIAGHTLTPAKPIIPFRSQCHSHLNLPATYMCSCQARLCVHCLNIHANGQLVPPHEQRYPYAQLADQARSRLQHIQANSSQECARLQKLLPVLQRNKKCVHEMASKARTEVAEQVVELCNAVIRRGNDIVTHIDLLEQEKLQKYAAVEQDLKIFVERFKKIENFSENALVMVQQDHPGMYSAGEFAHNAVAQVGKKLEMVGRDVELTQRLPKISYQSDLSQLVNAIRSLGIVDIDGQKTIPPLSTPQNARMFTITSATGGSVQAVRHPMSTVLNPPGGATIRQGPALIHPAGTSHQFNIPTNVGVVHPTSQPLIASTGRSMNAPQIRPANTIPTSVAVNGGNGLLSHLLQQNVHSISNSQAAFISCSSSGNNSLPKTPTTPNFTSHIQNTTAAAMVAPQQPQAHQISLSQQQIMLQQQQMAHRQQVVRNQQLVHQQATARQQQSQGPNVQQNQLLLQQLQVQQQLFQQQQQRMHQQQQQRDSAASQRQVMSHQNIQVPGSSTSVEGGGGRLLLRLPNPYRQQAPLPQQQQPTIAPSPVASPTLPPRLLSPHHHPHQPNHLINMSMVIPFSASSPLVSISQQQQFGAVPISAAAVFSQVAHQQPYNPQLLHRYQQQEELLVQVQQQQQQTAEAIKPKHQQRPILVELAEDEEDDQQRGASTSKTIQQDKAITEAMMGGGGVHPIRLKAQSVAADSTVNGGNGSSGDDSSVSPSPSALHLKRQSAPHNPIAEPFQKRPALERIVECEDRQNQSPSSLISTTTNEGGGRGNDQMSKTGNRQQRNDRQIVLERRKGTDGVNEAADDSDMMTTHGECSGMNSSGKANEAEDGDRNNNGRIGQQSGIKSSKTLSPNSSHPGSADKPRGDDLWDDYCYVCGQGCDDSTGSLGCCETCPKVFHARCHVPMVDGVMEDLPDDWRCTICLPCESLTQMSQSFGEREQLLCAKVYLVCFEDNSNAEPFLNAVPEDEAEYYAVIKEPIWMSLIARKISRRDYRLISEFVDDMNLLFRNCSTFNPPVHPLSNSAKEVYTLYMNAIRKFLPAYEKQIWVYVSLYNSKNSTANLSDEESTRRRTRRGISQQKAKSQTPI